MFERAPADGASGLSERLGQTPLAFTMRSQGGEHAPRCKPLQLGREQRANATRSRQRKSMKTYTPIEARVCTGCPAKRAERAALNRAPRDRELDAAAM